LEKEKGGWSGHAKVLFCQGPLSAGFGIKGGSRGAKRGEGPGREQLVFSPTRGREDHDSGNVLKERKKGKPALNWKGT